MREIKFRVWGKEFKEYFYDTAIFTDGTLWIKFDENGYDDVGYLSEIKDEFILEQYTGIKDKNGVEIYEGDILNYHYTQYDGNGCNATVIWQTSGFMLKNNNNGYLSNIEVFVGQPLKYEVIGNVHEEEKI